MAYVVHKVAVVEPDGWQPTEEGGTYWAETMAQDRPFTILPASAETFNPGEFLMYWQNDPNGPMAVYAITAVDTQSSPGNAICTLAHADPVIRALICQAAAGVAEPVTFT